MHPWNGLHNERTHAHTQLKTKDPYLSRMIQASEFALHRLVMDSGCEGDGGVGWEGGGGERVIILFLLLGGLPSLRTFFLCFDITI